MDAISAVTRTIKTLSDGTLRLSIDIEPNDAKQAFELLGTPGTPVALARLTQEAIKQQAQDETIEKAKGGFLSQWLAMRCNESEFWEFVESIMKPYSSDPDFYIDNPDECDKAVKALLLIESKVELDNNQSAADAFHKLIRQPYAKWIAGARG